MQTPVDSRRSYRFGLFEADPASGELLRQGVRVRLQDLPFRLLIILLEHAGEVVSREELRQQLWPADTFVEFDGSLNAALKRLRSALGESVENPVFIQTLPKRGYRFVAPVMRSAPEESDEEQAEPVSAHSSGTEQVPPSGIPDQASPTLVASPRIYGLTLAGVLLFVVLAALGWYSLWRLPSVTPSATVAAQPFPVRKSVAVLGFHNVSGRPQDDWLSTAISEMLSTELATGEKLRVVSGEEVANLRISSPWSQTSTLGRETTTRIGTALNSDILVLGSYSAIGSGDHGQLRFDVRLQDARTGEVLTQVAQTGNGSDLFRVASEIGTRLRQQLGVPEIKDTEQAGVLASLPLDPEGARFYSLGIAKLRDFDALAAKDLLEQATKTDPKFSLAHLMLSRAWAQLGYEQKHKEEAQKALDLSVDLPRIERLQVEGDYYEGIPDHEKAASAYRALFELFPDNVDYGLQLATSQSAAGHGSQALATLAQLRRLPAPASDDPRIDFLQSRTGPVNKPASLLLLRSAMQKANAQGKKLVYARAREDECNNMIWGGHPDQVSSCDEAYNIFLAAGNRLAAADAIRLIADSQGKQGNLEQAIATYQEALEILRGSGEHVETGAVLDNMADVFAGEGNFERAEQLYREAKLHFEQAGNKHNTMVAVTSIADMRYLRGDLPVAAKLYGQALDLDASLDPKQPEYPLYRLGDLELAQGHVHDAHRHVQQAVDVSRSHPGEDWLSGPLSALGDVLKAEGDLQAARQQYQLALDIEQKAGEMGAIGESQVALADLALEESHADQAEPLLRAAIGEFEKEKAVPDTARAYIVLSRTLLSQGKTEEARKAIQHAGDLSRTSHDPALKLPIAIQSARLMLAAVRQSERGYLNLGAVRQQLRSASDTARRLGYYGLECEARLALGELEVKANPGLGSSLLTQLAAEAHQHGMELISRKATALAGGTNGTVIAVAPSLPH